MMLGRLRQLAAALGSALVICSAVDVPAIAQGLTAKPPRRIEDVKPVYPAISLARGDEGAVIVEFKANSSGRVTDARVVWSTCAPLNDAAVTAVRRWRFEVVRINGKPSPFQGTAQVPFRLPERFKRRAGRPGSCIWIEPPKPLHVR